MKLSPTARAAAIGGLAATFVVTAALAPKVLGSASSQTYRPASDATTETAASPATATSTDIAAAEDSPVLAVQTAPAEATPTTTDRLTKVEDKVQVIDQRVTTLEQQATTTTTIGTTITTAPIRTSTPAPTGTEPTTPTVGQSVVEPTTTTVPTTTTTTTVAPFSCTVETHHDAAFPDRVWFFVKSNKPRQYVLLYVTDSNGADEAYGGDTNNDGLFYSGLLPYPSGSVKVVASGWMQTCETSW